MNQRVNEFGQPVGFTVRDWTARPKPTRHTMSGRFCTVTGLVPGEHADQLFDAFTQDSTGQLWTYMPYGPFQTRTAFSSWTKTIISSNDPLFYAIVDRASARAVGIASYLRIAPEHGVIEVGNIAFSPQMQRTPVATEAMYLMMAHAFDDLGYRRYEWKCDALNAPSRRAAERFGFSYDGIFEQAVVYKGRNRDTAWYSLLDRDWPKLAAGYQAWLSPENFSADGQQKARLADLLAQ